MPFLTTSFYFSCLFLTTFFQINATVTSQVNENTGMIDGTLDKRVHTSRDEIVVFDDPSGGSDGARSERLCFRPVLWVEALVKFVRRYICKKLFCSTEAT